MVPKKKKIMTCSTRCSSMTVFVVVVVVVVVLVVIVAVLCNLWSVVILKREEKSEKERISHKSCKVEERERERERE